MLYPLKFKPILKTLLWGSESWELSGVEGNESIVAEGPLKGKSISQLIEQFKGELVGKANYDRNGNEFPLLIKFIDARQDLSIQVHPNDELAAVRHHGSKGKTEMWYVVQADEGAHLMSGLSEKITPEEYAAKVEDNTITSVLHDYKVSAGDVFFLPAGRIHSIGAGCFIAEIQQTSDITYRIYDFGRLGLDGKPRELHTELSKAAIDYTVLPDYKTAYKERQNEETPLVDCNYFTTSLYNLDKPLEKDLSGIDSFLIVICTEGSGTLSDDKGNTVSVRKGETILLPACTSKVIFSPQGSLKFLTSWVR